MANTQLFFISVYTFLFSEVYVTSVFLGKYVVGITLRPCCSAPFVDSLYFFILISYVKEAVLKYRAAAMRIMSVRIHVYVHSAVSESASVCAKCCQCV